MALEKLDYCLTPYINAKYIKDLNVRPETIKLQEEIKGSTFFDINLSNILWAVFSGKENKSKYKQMGLYQTKKLFHSEGNYQQNEKAA